MNLRRIVIGLAACLVFSSAQANPYPSSPTEVFRQGIQQLTDFLANRDARNAPPIEAFVENTIAPFFDFAYMTRWAAGAQANFMSPQQGAAMEQKLRGHFLSSMIDKLAEYRHGRVTFLRPVGNPQTGELTLRLMAFQQGNPYPQRLSFRMYRSPQGWKVFDVSANGQSALAFYRTQFALEARPQPRPNYGAYPGAGQPRRPYGYARY